MIELLGWPPNGFVGKILYKYTAPSFLSFFIS